VTVPAISRPDDPRRTSTTKETLMTCRRRRLLPTAALAVTARTRRLRRSLGDSGMATAEYAIGTLAACGFAALLVAILKGGEVKALLLGIITKALSLG
jgi:hypothetical protein